MAWLEDYVLANVEVFVGGGIGAVKIQDQTAEPSAAAPRSIARLSALARLVRREHPDLSLGVIMQAHDAIGPIAVADAANADFVRLKVFVGAAITADGQRQGLSVEAMAYRAAIGRTDVAIFADVHDRTCQPLGDVPHDVAATWAQKAGADALIITGHSLEESRARIEAARTAGVTRPILLGGGVTEANAREAIRFADGIVVSTSLMRASAREDDLRRWDIDASRRLMEEIGRQ